MIKNTLKPSQAARALDCLLGRRNLSQVFAEPSSRSQVLQDQGDLRQLFRGRCEVLSWHFPTANHLAPKERKWLAETVCTFFRAYFRCLSLCFPSLEVESKCGGFDLSCGRELLVIGDYIRLFKDLCTSPLSYSLRNSRDLLLPFYGPARSYLRVALRRQSSRAMVFCNSALQFKRVCPKVPDSFVDASLSKHRAALTAPRRQSSDFCRIVASEAASLLRRLKKSSNYNFPEEECRQISSRATIEAPGFLEGGFGYYQNFSGDYDRCGNFRPVIRYWDVSEGGVTTYRCHKFPTFDQLHQELSQIPRLKRKVVAITEPLKVRVITVHHASETNLFGSWQKSMARSLSQLDEVTSGKSLFDENGQPQDFCSADFSAMKLALHDVSLYGFGKGVIVSDDASAATDSICPELSAAVCCASVSDEVKPLFGRWTGVVEYPDGTTVEQTNGQLMGDRRSFPTLCLIHLAAKRAFCRHWGITNPFIRINGDDGLIVLPCGLVEKYFDWMENLWEINRMKTYVSPRFFSFNSVLYDLRSTHLVPLLRFNIVDGRDKFGGASDDPRIFNSMITECPEWGMGSMTSWFIASPVWHPILSKASAHGINWFLPQRSGGLGLKYPGAFSVTPQQRFMINKAFEGSDDYQVRISSRPRFEDKVSTLKLPTHWSVEGNRPEAPAPLRVKPIVGKTRVRYPRLPRGRCWDEGYLGQLPDVWRQRRVLTGFGVSVDLFPQASLGVSIEHCKSCLPHHNNEEESS